jgi:hypothetical protein
LAVVLQVVLAYLSNPTWLLGLLLDVGGGGAMLGTLRGCDTAANLGFSIAVLQHSSIAAAWEASSRESQRQLFAIELVLYVPGWQQRCNAVLCWGPESAQLLQCCLRLLLDVGGGAATGALGGCDAASNLDFKLQHSSSREAGGGYVQLG